MASTATHALSAMATLCPTSNPASACARALENPVSGPPLSSLLKPNARVAVVIDDFSLPVPQAARDCRREMMEALILLLSDRGITASDLGVVALTCAAVDDVSAWCLLALVVGVTQSRAETAWLVVVLALAYTALMLLFVRPLVARAGSRRSASGSPRSNRQARSTSGTPVAFATNGAVRDARGFASST